MEGYEDIIQGCLGMIECPVCNSYNPDGVVVCMVCTQPLPKSNLTDHEYGRSKAKLALFNLEDAVLDNAAATRVAKRKQTKKGRKFDFELAQNLEKDVLIPGAKNFIDDLVQDGFKVAFVSQKSKEHMFRQKEHLQQLGIPLMSDARGVMLYMSTDSKVIKDLKEMYDIQFFFGESEKTAKRARIPGVYRNIEEYTGVRANPYLAPEEGKGAYTLVNPLPNPPLKPKRKKMKNGKYRKEPAKKYVQRFMDDPKMIAEFPDRSQRYAVAMSYAEQFYGARKNVPMDISDSVAMGAEERAALDQAHYDEQAAQRRAQEAAREAARLAEEARIAALKANHPQIKAEIKAWAERNIDPYMSYAIPQMRQAPFYMSSLPPNSNSYEGAAKDRLSTLWKNSKKAGLDMEAYLSELYGVTVSVSMTPRAGWWQIDLYGQSDEERKASRERMLREEPPRPEPHPRGPGSLFMNPPKSNPPSKKKMKKAKKVYKSFNQKDPVEIKNEMVDVGDVWVSLGKAWCIGYRSGKEGLGDEQKYIHHFGVDEETGKKYEEPELYLSMPEKGKPMLMLKGGGWKVKSADGNISWIYH